MNNNELYVGCELICHSLHNNTNYYTIGKKYKIAGIYDIKSYGMCITILDDNQCAHSYSINIVNDLNYSSWFESIKKTRKKKLKKLYSKI